MLDIFTYLVELPDGINEAVLSCVGGYTVYIDPRQSNDGMKRSYEHALHHIQNADFEKSNIQQIESQAHT